MYQIVQRILIHVFISGLSEIEKRKNQQRFIKTHLPFHLLPDQISEKNAKIIYIHRDPKDMMVSYYFFARILTFINYIGTLKEFAWQVMLNKVPYGPYFDHLNNYLTAAQNQPKKVRGNPKLYIPSNIKTQMNLSLDRLSPHGSAVLECLQFC